MSESDFKVNYYAGDGVVVYYKNRMLRDHEIEEYFMRFEYQEKLIKSYAEEIRRYESFFNTLKGFLDLSEITNLKKEQEKLEHELDRLGHNFYQHRASSNQHRPWR